MKITPEQAITIQELFKQMNSKTDFLALLNEAKKIVYGEKALLFAEKQLNYYINKDAVVSKDLNGNKMITPKENLLFQLNEGDNFLKNSQKKPCYVSFTIKKKANNQFRTIYSPVKGLKEFQKALNIILQCVHQPHSAANGFVLGKSIVDNAKLHINQIYVYNLDLKDFFPSVDKSRIWGRLLIAPFNLNTSDERMKIANMIAGLSCTPMEVERLIDNNWTKIIKSVLPQGAPTSPTLTNAICEKMDIRLSGVAKRFGLNYTRYADDITFSGKHNNYEITANTFEKIFVASSTFDNEVRRIIADQKFNVKESKVRLQKEGYRQEVTGLLVNEKVNVTRRYVKLIRQWLYYWETYGYDKSYTFFLQKYITDKGHIKNGQPNMMMVLDGKLLYLKMVKGENDSSYLKLKERFYVLTDETTISKESNSKTIVDQILEIGLEEAMKNYKM